MMDIFRTPKIDCHNHVFDPDRFPYHPASPYNPSGHELATASQFKHVLDIYGVTHALLVGPNSAYGENDNRCILDAIAQSNGRFKGMAVVSMDTSLELLASLKQQGIVGVTFNVAFYGLEHFKQAADLLAKLRSLDMIAQVQVEHDQMVHFAPILLASGCTLLVDHSGRPDLTQGVEGDGFQAVLSLAESNRAYIKISGFAKFSQQAYPYADTDPYVAAILRAYGSEFCVWGSDWPFLRAPHRMDYGPMLALIEKQIPNEEVRHKVLWENAYKLFGFE